MKKGIIDKAKLEDTRARIEIFCDRRYKDYYVRGNVIAILDSIKADSQKSRKHYVQTDYRFVIVVLVNKDYLERTKKDIITNDFRFRDSEFEWNTGNMFRWRSQREYVNERKNWLLARPKELEKSGRHIQEWEEEIFKGETLVIELDETGIAESPYLKESIRAKKQIILLDIDFFVHGADSYYSDTVEDYHKRIYTIPAFYCTGDDKEFGEEYGVPHWFDKLYEFLYSNLDYGYLEHREYSGILKLIGNLSLEWIHKNAISKRFLKKLNRLSTKIGDRTYPLTDFCWRFYDDLVDDLTTQKQIAGCQFCGDFFIYQQRWPTKKFCTSRFERKNCGKACNNSLHYQRHVEEIRPKAKEYQRKKRAEKKEQDRLKKEKKREENRIYQKEYRALLKKWNVKK